MSEANEQQADTAVARPPSWLRILAGYWLAGAVLVLAGILLVQFLQHRPDDLVAYTGHLVDNVLEQTLRANQVPADRIFRTDSQMRRDDHARWMDFTIDVYLPPRVSADGLRELAREALLEQGVKLEVLSSAPEGQSWRLHLGRLPFATVRLRDRSLAAQVVTDLAAASNRITNAVEDMLFEAGANEASFSRGAPEVRNDEATRWTHTALALTLPDGLTPGELRGRIETALVEHDVRVTTEDTGLDAVLLHVAYAGKPCTDILCRSGLGLPPGEGPAPPVPMPEVTTEPPVPDPPALETAEDVPEAPITPPPGAAAEAESPPAPAVGPDPPGPREKRGRVAIILDDGGNDWAVAEQVLALNTGLTLAVLPNTPFGAQVAEAAAQKGFGLMLHMPMETDSKTVDPGPGKVTTEMEQEEIQRLTREALAQVPGAEGVNNHTGSAMTADREKIGFFLDVLKEEGLFFVDSRTTSATVALDVALEKDLPAAGRDVFLDDVNDTETTETRLAELADLALARGTAIGIGHFRAATAEVLARELPGLAEKGVTLVHVSELIP